MFEGSPSLEPVVREPPAVREEPVPGVSVFALRAAEQDVLVVTGEADLSTADLLYRLVLRALPSPPRPVLVELGALTFCDLHGLDALRDVAGAAERVGVALAFRGESEQLQWLQRTVPARGGRCGRRTPALLDANGGTP